MLSAILFSNRPKLEGEQAGGFFGDRSERIGIIELNGVIVRSKKVLKKLDDFEKDKRIKGVVIRMNSPGGGVAPSQEIFEAVKAFSKPVYVSMGSVAASGAYYIACGAKKVFANPGTITGSIGVLMQFANLKKLYQWAKIERYTLKTGKFKDAGSDHRAMTPEEKELFLGMLQDVLDQFRSAVKEGRKMTPASVRKVSDGRIFSGRQAKDLKLVDELGTLQDTIEALGKELGIKGKPKVVYHDRKRSKWIDFILDHRPEEEAKASSSNIGQWVRNFLQIPEQTQVLDPGLYWLWDGA